MTSDFFDAEFEIFFGRGFHPVKADEFLELAFGDFRLVGGAIPGEAEYIIPLVNFIGEPFLQPCGECSEIRIRSKGEHLTGYSNVNICFLLI